MIFIHRRVSDSLHLDYPASRMRWSHGKGQYNNWCQCAGLPSSEASEACDILSIRTAQDPAGAACVLRCRRHRQSETVGRKRFVAKELVANHGEGIG